jgi:hypothetical protein
MAAAAAAADPSVALSLQLLHAATAGLAFECTRLLDAKAQVLFSDQQGRHALHLATHYGHRDTCAARLEA